MIALTIDDGPADPYTGADARRAEEVEREGDVLPHRPERRALSESRPPHLGRRSRDRQSHATRIRTSARSPAATRAAGDQRDAARFSEPARTAPRCSSARRTTRTPSRRAEEEVQPIVLASQLNYITVLRVPRSAGLERRRSRQTARSDTADRAGDARHASLQQLGTEKGSCILLHDGGGDRTETVKLIPLLVNELRKRGLHVRPRLGADRLDARQGQSAQ